MTEKFDLIDTYRRIIKSAKKGQGTRLTAQECHAMWVDNAIEQAVWADDDAKDEAEDDATRFRVPKLRKR